MVRIAPGAEQPAGEDLGSGDLDELLVNMTSGAVEHRSGEGLGLWRPRPLPTVYTGKVVEYKFEKLCFVAPNKPQLLSDQGGGKGGEGEGRGRGERARTGLERHQSNEPHAVPNRRPGKTWGYDLFSVFVGRIMLQ